MSQTAQTPNRSSFPAVIAILGVFLIFYFVIDATYLTNPGSSEEETTAERPSLAEHRGLEADTLNNYKVIDPGAGKVRLPIDRAMDLVVAENAK